jgi:hypothetical protein
MRLAEATMREAASLRAVTDRLAFDQKALPAFLLDRDRHDEALSAARTLAESPFPAARAVAHALAGEAFLLLGRGEEAALFRLESIARAAREAGDWELAEHTARQMLEHDPAYGGSHLAAALVARHRGDIAAADQSLAAAARYWRDADPDLPELRLTRRASAAR